MALLSNASILNIGLTPNDGTGDNLRQAFITTKENFNSVYSFLQGTPSFSNVEIFNTLTLQNQLIVSNISAGNISSQTLNSGTITSNSVTVSGTTTSGALYFTNSISSPSLYVDSNILNWNNHAILTSNNFNAYTPTLTGNGASGTWGIDISGSLLSATTLPNGTSSTTQLSNDNSTRVATTAYVDTGFVHITGDTMTGALTVPAGATGSQVPRRSEVDSAILAEANIRIADDNLRVTSANLAATTGSTLVGTPRGTLESDLLLKVAKTSNTGAALLPVGTTAQRDAAPVAGEIRYNTDTLSFEGFGNAWGSIGGGATGGVSSSVFYENDIVVTASYTITSGKNAMTAGPITINTGVVITIPTGSVWTIV